MLILAINVLSVKLQQGGRGFLDRAVGHVNHRPSRPREHTPRVLHLGVVFRRGRGDTRFALRAPQGHLYGVVQLHFLLSQESRGSRFGPATQPSFSKTQARLI